jgi:hypothetical protein
MGSGKYSLDQMMNKPGIFDNANTFGVDKNKGMKDIKIYNQTFGLYLGYRF